MLKSRQKILDTAKECFFQHGYSATSIAMISRYSNVSRVTIHKQFSSKEVLFREFIRTFLEKSDNEILEYIDSKAPLWRTTYEFLSGRCSKAFDIIPNAIVKADIVHAGKNYCSDLLDDNTEKTRKAIELKLQQAIDNNTICIKALNLSVEELASNIELVARGIILSTNEGDPSKIIEQTLHAYDLATKK